MDVVNNQSMFSDNALKSIVERTLNQDINIPDGHKGAFVTVVDANGLRTVIASKINNTWNVYGDIGYHPHTGLEYGVTVKATW